MLELKERIIKEGKNLGGGILKVDSLINHQVDPHLMDACGREFARLLRLPRPPVSSQPRSPVSPPR